MRSAFHRYLVSCLLALWAILETVWLNKYCIQDLWSQRCFVAHWWSQGVDRFCLIWVQIKNKSHRWASPQQYYFTLRKSFLYDDYVFIGWICFLTYSRNDRVAFQCNFTAKNSQCGFNRTRGTAGTRIAWPPWIGSHGHTCTELCLHNIAHYESWNTDFSPTVLEVGRQNTHNTRSVLGKIVILQE